MTGLILLDKPADMSSFLAAKLVGKVFGEKRVGHTGTLDPMATGVLPILLGRSTRLSGILLEADKSYEAEILLGTVTDTSDITGNVLSVNDVSLTLEMVEKALNKFRGVISQKPPIYSAIKQNGVRLYELARKGKTADIPSRQVEIKKLELLSFEGDRLKVDVTCSKGTYIRSLAVDIGEELGCGATLSQLRRTSTGGFDISRCATLDQIREAPQSYLVDAGECVGHLSAVTVTDNQRKRFLHGGELFIARLSNAPQISQGEIVRVYDRAGALLGIAQAEGEVIKVKCIVFEGD